MTDFNAYLKTLKQDLVQLAGEFGEEYKDELVADGTAFAMKAREDLERWTQQLAQGDLSTSDFKFLVKGKKDLAKMEMLKKKGMAKVKIDQMRQRVIKTIVKAAEKVVSSAI